jgi:hypothetical protein
MEEIQMAIRIQLRRDVESDWISDNPILLAGEIAISSDLNKFKIGNGSRWNSTSYYSSLTTQDLENTLSSYVEVGDVGNAGGPAKLDVDGNLLIPKDKIIIEGSTSNDYELTLQSPDVSSDIIVNLPNASGTIALLSQVPTSYNDLTNKPALFPGSYSNLTDKPTLFSGSYIDLTNKPTLFSGSYNALTEKPSLFSGVYADLTEKPSLFSGAYDDLSGKPTIPSLTGYATETYVETQISNVIGAAPGALNTLNEIAAAINDNTSYAATITTELTAKAPLASPTFTGTVSGITKSMVGLGNVDNTTDDLKPISTATLNALNLKAPLSSPEFTGTVSGITKTMVGLGNVDNTSDVEKFLIVINSQSSSYTLQGSDANKMIEMTEVSTLTIPNDSTHNFPIGTYIEVLQTTSNQVTIAGESFLPNATPGLKLRSQWSSASLIKRAANSWVVLGDLKA